MKYAIQNKRTGATVEYCNNATEAIAQYFLSNEEFELVETANKSVIKVYYCEPSSPNSYGHSEESFVTYGSIKRCICNLIKWMQETTRLFGPDARDVYDFFKYCHLEINSKDKSEWLYDQLHKMNYSILYV